MKLFSIIIATHHAAETLPRCLDSIRGQKAADVELLLIDALSTDATLSVVEQNKDIVDYAISEKDTGIYDAWNKGVRAANGQWILFLGADDYLLPGALDTYRRFLLSSGTGYDYISAQLQYVDEQGRLLKNVGEAWDWNHFRQKMTVAHVASLHNRTLFEEVGLFDLSYRICADYELLLRKQAALKAGFVPAPIAVMQMGGASFSVAAIWETCRILCQIEQPSLFRKYMMWGRKMGEFYFFRLRIPYKRWRQKREA